MNFSHHPLLIFRTLESTVRGFPTGVFAFSNAQNAVSSALPFSFPGSLFFILELFWLSSLGFSLRSTGSPVFCRISPELVRPGGRSRRLASAGDAEGISAIVAKDKRGVISRAGCTISLASRQSEPICVGMPAVNSTQPLARTRDVCL